MIHFKIPYHTRNRIGVTKYCPVYTRVYAEVILDSFYIKNWEGRSIKVESYLSLTHFDKTTVVYLLLKMLF